MKKKSVLPNRISLYFIFLLAFGMLFYPACQNKSPDRKSRIIVTVTGTVVDSITGKHIQGAWIDMRNSKTTRTDSKGWFRIFTPDENVDFMEISSIGYSNKLCPSKDKNGVYRSELGKIRLAPEKFHKLPLSHYAKTSPSERERYLLMPYPGYEYRRTTRPPNLLATNFSMWQPSIIAARRFDKKNGEWVLFKLSDIGQCFITHFNSDGSKENSCLTELGQYSIDSLETYEDIVLIYANKYVNYKKESIISKYSLFDLRTDSDGDGLVDRYELLCGLNHNNGDSDNDGISDLIDPMPLLSRQSVYNDTSAIFAACLESGEYLLQNDYYGNSLYLIEGLFPEKINNFLDQKIESLKRNNKYLFSMDYKIIPRGFEYLLINMTPDEIQFLLPYIQKANENNYGNRTKYFSRFPYLKYLKNVNDANWPEIKQRLIDDVFAFFIVPCHYDGRPLEYSSHPLISGNMYLPIDESLCDGWRYYGPLSQAIKLKLTAIDSTEAIVSDHSYEYDLVKRNGEWVVVSSWTASPL